MTRHLAIPRSLLPLMFGICLAPAAHSGCSRATHSAAPVRNECRAATTFAVAPVLNFTGDMKFDSMQAADLLASELSDVEGVTVLPVNRVAAVLETQGKSRIESPDHAAEVARLLGADAILVAGITEYDPYTPVVGLAMQIYTARGAAQPQDSSLNPAEFSRHSRPEAEVARTTDAGPIGQIQHVYNAAHSRTVDAVRNYAGPRTQPDHAYGWRQYLKVQSLYLRFCWHDALRQLMDQQRRDSVRLAADGWETQSQ